MRIKPKGAKVLMEELSITDKEQTTIGGLVFNINEKDFPDKILFKGKVIEIGTPEIDVNGLRREPDIEVGTIVYYDKRKANIVLFKDQKRYWVANCQDIYAVEICD